MLTNKANHVYIAQSGLVGKDGIDTKAGRANYQVDGDTFKLADEQNELAVPFVFEKDGVTFRKIFVLKRGAYDIAVNFEIDNQSDKTIEVEPYGQLRHTLVEDTGNVAMPTYTGGAYSSSETNYKNTVLQTWKKPTCLSQPKLAGSLYYSTISFRRGSQIKMRIISFIA